MPCGLENGIGLDTAIRDPIIMITNLIRKMAVISYGFDLTTSSLGLGQIFTQGRGYDNPYFLKYFA